jgi:hypothetical protein
MCISFFSLTHGESITMKEGRFKEDDSLLFVNVCSTILKHAFTFELLINKTQLTKAKYINLSSIT